jgi:hypothetical protein
LDLQVLVIAKNDHEQVFVTSEFVLLVPVLQVLQLVQSVQVLLLVQSVQVLLLVQSVQV